MNKKYKTWNTFKFCNDKSEASSEAQIRPSTDITRKETPFKINLESFTIMLRIEILTMKT